MSENQICPDPLARWVSGEPPICLGCGACAVTENQRFIDFECGSSWDVIEGVERSEKCRKNEKGDR